jgi:hypothetical protein
MRKPSSSPNSEHTNSNALTKGSSVEGELVAGGGAVRDGGGNIAIAERQLGSPGVTRQ